ncbi:MAG: hypothetical protein ACRCZF_12895 [Gemmataceae bacterium]
MRTANWKLLLVVLWLGMAVALWFREGTRIEAVAACGLIALWNLARSYRDWAVQSREVEPVRPLRSNRESVAYEYNPEFDFQKMDPPPPSSSSSAAPPQ